MIPLRFLCFMCLGLTANPHESIRIPTNPYESVPKTCANPSRIRKLDHMSSVFVNSVRCPDIAYSRALFYYPTDLHHGLCTPLPPMWFGFGAHTERSIASVGSCQGFCFPHECVGCCQMGTCCACCVEDCHHQAPGVTRAHASHVHTS